MNLRFSSMSAEHWLCKVLGAPNASVQCKKGMNPGETHAKCAGFPDVWVVHDGSDPPLFRWTMVATLADELFQAWCTTDTTYTASQRVRRRQLILASNDVSGVERQLSEWWYSVALSVPSGRLVRTKLLTCPCATCVANVLIRAIGDTTADDLTGHASRVSVRLQDTEARLIVDCEEPSLRVVATCVAVDTTTVTMDMTSAGARVVCGDRVVSYCNDYTVAAVIEDFATAGRQSAVNGSVDCKHRSFDMAMSILEYSVHSAQAAVDGIVESIRSRPE